MEKSKNNRSFPLHLNIGLNADIQPLTRSASGWYPKVFVKTFGCQMNVRDSEALLGIFSEKGYRIAQSPEDADVILVNTCSVREHAEHRAISYLGALKKKERIAPIRGQFPFKSPFIGLIGCMARARGEEIFRKMPYIDLVCGPASFDRIPEYVEAIYNRAPEHQSTRAPSHQMLKTKHQSTSKRIIDLEDRLRNEDFYRAPFREDKSHAYVVISTGCSNRCSYCVVPFTRGPLRLRSPENIIEEVKRNVSLGIKKITLLGQNVNDYQYKSQVTSHKLQVINFVDLLKMVEEVEGVEEIGFVTNNPKNTSVELFEFIAKSKKIKKRLHIPFQSGSDRILKAMNRGYTRNKYLEIVKAYKNIVGGIIGTDVIVGFPGETQEDFLQTKSLLEEVRFNYAYIFMYSARPNTAAEKLKDDVPLEEKKRRHKILLDLQKEISKGIIKFR